MMSGQRIAYYAFKVITRVEVQSTSPLPNLGLQEVGIGISIMSLATVLFIDASQSPRVSSARGHG